MESGESARRTAMVALAALALGGGHPAPPSPGAGGVPVASPPSAFPFPVVESTLPNGLRVYVVPYDSPGLVAYYSVVRTGSRNEVEAGRSGFAHFFEHMMFRGTDRFPQDKYNDV